MISLEQIKVASPCHADWDEMTGTEQTRFCQSCRKNVYNLSEMTRAEAEALIQEKEGRLCVRFYTRADGTMLTQDCPVGLRAMRVKLVKKFSYAAALLLAGFSGLLRGASAAPGTHNKPLTPPLLAQSHFPPAQSHQPELVENSPFVLHSDDTESFILPSITQISMGMVAIVLFDKHPPYPPPPPGHTRR